MSLDPPTTKPIRLAVTRAGILGIELAAFPARAAQLGFDGIVVEQCLPSELPIAVLSSTIGFTGVRHADAEAAHRIRHLIDQARQCGCTIVELPDAAGDPRKMSPLAIGDWLLPLADDAAVVGVTLAVCNGPVLRTTSVMWNFLERIDHPAMGCSWDIEQARRWDVGMVDATGAAVPVLGARIMVGRFGSVNASTRRFIERLRGIGFRGWLVAAPGTVLDDASLAMVREWISPTIAPNKAAARKPLPAKTVPSNPSSRKR